VKIAAHGDNPPTIGVILRMLQWLPMRKALSLLLLFASAGALADNATSPARQPASPASPFVHFTGGQSPEARTAPPNRPRFELIVRARGAGSADMGRVAASVECAVPRRTPPAGSTE
jgi:hypothetical protein